MRGNYWFMTSGLNDGVADVMGFERLRLILGVIKVIGKYGSGKYTVHG